MTAQLGWWAQPDAGLPTGPAVPPGEAGFEHSAAPFEAVGQIPTPDGGATVAVIHGAVAVRNYPLVHVVPTRAPGDGSSVTSRRCRAERAEAIGRMVGEGAGVLIYTIPARPNGATRAGAPAVEATAVAGLLRGAGVSSLRLVPHADELARQLRALGLDVASPESDW
jgi:GTP cyclohydrolase II